MTISGLASSPVRANTRSVIFSYYSQANFRIGVQLLHYELSLEINFSFINITIFWLFWRLSWAQEGWWAQKVYLWIRTVTLSLWTTRPVRFSSSSPAGNSSLSLAAGETVTDSLQVVCRLHCNICQWYKIFALIQLCDLIIHWFCMNLT